MKAHNEKYWEIRDQNLKDFQSDILSALKELDDKFVSKKAVELILKTIWYASMIAIAIWQILEWYQSLHK